MQAFNTLHAEGRFADGIGYIMRKEGKATLVGFKPLHLQHCKNVL